MGRTASPKPSKVRKSIERTLVGESFSLRLRSDACKDSLFRLLRGIAREALQLREEANGADRKSTSSTLGDLHDSVKASITTANRYRAEGVVRMELELLNFLPVRQTIELLDRIPSCSNCMLSSARLQGLIMLDPNLNIVTGAISELAELQKELLATSTRIDEDIAI